MSIRNRLLLASTIALVALSSTTGAMTITIKPVAGGVFDSSSANFNSAAYSALQAAVATDASYFSDPINVNITFDMNSSFSSSSIIGQTLAQETSASYTAVTTAMKTDGDLNAVRAALLPVTPPSFTTNSGFTINPNTVVLTTANAKAIGLSINAPASDATITFNSTFAFGYDPNNPQAGKVDFTTVVEHELLHALGFTSNVDVIDEDLSKGTTSGTVNPTTLDLFRFKTGATATALSPRDMAVGSDDSFSDGLNSYRMATGTDTAAGGDGSQASHWKDQSNQATYIGIMDPTLPPDQVEHITAADLQAMAAIGYRVTVPEPASVLMLAAGSLLLRSRRRSRA